MGKQETLKIRSELDGMELSVLISEPECGAGERPRGVIQMLHGMCEYKERYQALIQYLNDNGFVCVIHDHRGHGASVKSQEDLGYTYGAGADGLVEDARQINDWIRKRFCGVPIILFGHSMGSMVARCFAKKYDDRMDALILSGPPSNNPGRAPGTMLTKLQQKLRGGRSRGKLIEKLSFGGYKEYRVLTEKRENEAREELQRQIRQHEFRDEHKHRLESHPNAPNCVRKLFTVFEG